MVFEMKYLGKARGHWPKPGDQKTVRVLNAPAREKRTAAPYGRLRT